MDRANRNSAEATGRPSNGFYYVLDGLASAHPVSLAAGAAGGVAGGAAVGAVLGGPIGAVAGAIAGAIAGGITGHECAELVNPTGEHAYWRAHFRNRPYYARGLEFEDFSPAYELGWHAYLQDGAAGHTFEEIEADLQYIWEECPASARVNWEQARAAMYDAWTRTKFVTFGDPSGPLPNTLVED